MRPAPAAAARPDTPRHRPVARCCVSHTASGTIAAIARRRPCTARSLHDAASCERACTRAGECTASAHRLRR
eukprot:7310426-Prymnesium_polylepis.1